MEVRQPEVELEPIIKVEEWIFLILLGMIPILNVGVFTYFSISQKVNANKQNFSRAVLAYLVIITLLVIITTILM